MSKLKHYPIVQTSVLLFLKFWFYQKLEKMRVYLVVYG